ncbi:DUF3885 domain-containing protein [Clostridium brassicae]|uniref:DUF3885 domain-containing protein n=1 Tax=Clostridium brassicae TaxID=2999072 RepID=A0ABT4DE08_9CLOT|nr:DUF3885 domain-containing protein [Clostridium brassicae]MCY6960550.1 DUF3885 domain-containing protein [Clostridium brassicae]
MNLYINNLFNEYCYATKDCISFELAPNQSPYYDVESEDLKYREEYVDLCIENACKIWEKCKFSKELIVLYEDKFGCHEKNEKEFVENTLQLLNCIKYPFKWRDDEETYKGIRYIWQTNKININELFKKIILSDIGEDTQLDCAIYIIDNQTKNVFFLYDDRGVDVYSNDKKFINKIK